MQKKNTYGSIQNNLIFEDFIGDAVTDRPYRTKVNPRKIYDLYSV